MPRFDPLIRCRTAIALAAGCGAVTAPFLAGCATIDEIRGAPIVRTIESFELCKTPPNSYWYDGRSYEYNQYEILMRSDAVPARIIWNGAYIGTTPFTYRFTGVLEKGERVSIRAVPVDEQRAAQEAVLKIIDELPRKIDFTEWDDK